MLLQRYVDQTHAILQKNFILKNKKILKFVDLGLTREERDLYICGKLKISAKVGIDGNFRKSGY